MELEERKKLFIQHNHFFNYPRLTPWVGKNYFNNKRILVIGESHYLPKGVTYHHDIDKWYAGNELELQDHIKKFAESEKDKINGISYISTNGIMRFRSSDVSDSDRKRFSARGHTIYRNIFKILNDVIFQYDNYLDSVDEIAYYNFFQRPANITGDSIKPNQKDIEYAIDTFDFITKQIKPDIIIVVSKLSGLYLKDKLNNYSHIITVHPACAWWNRKNKKGYSGKELFSCFFKEHL
jgi:hypothetical protein